jgi:thioredoxin reductase
VAVVGGGDSALDAGLMVLGRGGRVELIVQEAVPIAKPDTLARVKDAGGSIRVAAEIRAAEFAGEQIRLTLTAGRQCDCSLVIVQIGFLSAKETFERQEVKLNEDGSIAVAWAEGVQAAIHAFKEITSPYWLNEKRLRDNKIALICEKIAQAARSRKRIS